MGIFQELENAVAFEYKRAVQVATEKGERTSTSDISIGDINDVKGHRPSTTKLEVLEAWMNLVSILKTHHGFGEYLKSAKHAFDFVNRAKPLDYRHLKTLVNLLAHTVENRNRDNSTECRFVTLLEVLLSYGDDWEPSEEVSGFWVRLMQRIPADVPPISFRRKAYRVLVSLSWVPSSKGLLEACSFEGNKQNLSDASQAGVKAQLAKIRNRPLPRYDCVNQLLDRLKDETDVCVAITSEKEGTGKTTLAALVASHPSILRVFKVLWLPMTKEEITYEKYTKMLNILCEQMGIEMQWPECIKRFEEPALRLLREEACILQAREAMSELLLQEDVNILLILDDVTDAKQVKKFHFNERQSIIATTPDSNLEGVDWTIDLDPMSEEEAIELFLNEANLPTSHILGLTVEVKSIVQQCGCHPLTIRSVARWYQLAQVTAGIVKGMEELRHGLNACCPATEDMITEENDDEYEAQMLFDVLSLMMGPSRNEGQETSVLFVMCFAAMAVVFPDRAPLDAVILLWEQLLKVEPFAIKEMEKDGVAPARKELQKHAWFVAEGLTHMGVINVIDEEDGPWVEVHHNLYRDFATIMAREMDLAETFEETTQNWHRAFVSIYFEQRIQGESESVDDNSWAYAIEYLSSHMLKSKSYKMAETVLSEENFFRARIEAMGLERAIDVHVEDCVQLQRALDDDQSSSNDSQPSISSVFMKAASMICTETECPHTPTVDDSAFDSSRALYKIAAALAELGRFEEAIQQFTAAQKLLPQDDPSQELASLRASILYGNAWALLARNDSSEALKKVKASLKIMEQIPEPHILYTEVLKLQADILVDECKYLEAVNFLEGIVEQLKPDSQAKQLELGTVLLKKGWLHNVIGEPEKAKSILAECVKCKLEISECSRNLALAYCGLGDVCMELYQLTEARDHFDNAILTLDALRCDPSEVDHLLSIGKLRFLRNDSQGCSQALESARNAITRSPSLPLDQSAYKLRSIARVYQGRGDLNGAISVLHESLALTVNRPRSLERSSALLELGNCLLDQEDFNEGLISLEQSLEIRIAELGECLQVLHTLKAIGKVHVSLGAADEALKVFQKVYEVIGRIAPGDTEAIAEVKYSIGEVYRTKGIYSKAIKTFKECTRLLELERSPDHADIAKALQSLGDISIAKNNLHEAEEYYLEAHRIRRMHFDESLLAETQHSLGVLWRKLGDYEEAHEMLLDALENRKRNSANTRETAETLLEIGKTFRMQSDMESAMSLYEKSLELLSDSDQLVGSVCLEMGHVQFSLGHDLAALQRYERARTVRLTAFGKDDMKTGNALRSLGIVNFLMEKADEALVLLNEFVRICELNTEEDAEDENHQYKEYNNETVDYILAVVLLGDIHVSKGKIDQAQIVWDVAKEICDENEGVKEELPGLITMIDRRLEDVNARSPGSKRSKFFNSIQSAARFSEEAVPKLRLLSITDEVAVLRQILFIDD